MLNAGSIEKNSQESRNLLIINKSDKSFKLYLDGGYIDVVNCNSEMNLPLSCADHALLCLIQIPVNLFNFAGITLACSIENLVTQGCGSLPEKMESILTRSDFSIDIDIIGDTTMLIADDVAIVSEDVNSTSSYDKSVQKRADKKRAMCFLMLYVLPIFLLLITVSAALLCISIRESNPMWFFNANFHRCRVKKIRNASALLTFLPCLGKNLLLKNCFAPKRLVFSCSVVLLW